MTCGFPELQRNPPSKHQNQQQITQTHPKSYVLVSERAFVCSIRLDWILIY